MHNFSASIPWFSFLAACANFPMHSFLSANHIFLHNISLFRLCYSLRMMNMPNFLCLLPAFTDWLERWKSTGYDSEPHKQFCLISVAFSLYNFRIFSLFQFLSHFFHLWWTCHNFLIHIASTTCHQYKLPWGCKIYGNLREWILHGKILVATLTAKWIPCLHNRLPMQPGISCKIYGNLWKWILHGKTLVAMLRAKWTRYGVYGYYKTQNGLCLRLCSYVSLASFSKHTFSFHSQYSTLSLALQSTANTTWHRL